MSVFVAFFGWAAQGVPAGLVVVLLTAAVRGLLLPLSVASARGQRERARLAPRIAELRRKHARDPERLQRAVLDLHTREKVSPLAGCLPGLLQIPVFFVLYQAFSEEGIAEGYSVFGVSLGARWADVLGAGGFFGGGGVFYLALFAVVAAVATCTYRSTRVRMGAVPADGDVPGMGAMVKVMPLLSFATLVTVAVVPLAAALYVVTSTTWTAAERAVLYRSST
ncbi:YidC/Oxa1 family membrane protein insertase [Streptomyces sp. MUM 203J]|uniref:YidC/Oxa1 family membrane protein insertase n=1 Tax=Streptomyces sp. MUM 203J TaxID=2791990 RepID=UPI001F04BABC|nr:YidC/Oxa1 family membrane protein insertase [Streptomyces sp. MUM 203J]MCH0540453.1 YidC/Oxa1 family membrane protein insertase [Streptomyces sp. MUM 203J]